jgi:hypothetical protein
MSGKTIYGEPKKYFNAYKISVRVVGEDAPLNETLIA